MNKENKGTVYQELNQFLNLDGFSAQNKDQAPEQKQKIIIKGNSPEEIKRKGLELEQKRELQNKFFRTSDRGFQKALQYEAARLPAYMDFEGMEYYPIISSALDLFMEEATTIGMEGKMLTINSNKERIKSLLETFFYDIVNVNVNLPFWTRNMPIKYDSMIPLLDGTEIKIIELSERLKKNPNEEIWTYSIQDNTNKIVAGKIVWCDLTRKDSDILKVTFDDGTYVETTPDHEYMLRTGKYLRADELKSGMSLMPLNTSTSKISLNEAVYDPSTNNYIVTNNIIPNEYINSDNIEHNENTILNRKVVSVEKLSEKYDVYCMEVVGKNNEQDRHNFPVCSKDQNGNYTRNGVFLSNCKYGDNFVHLYGEKSKGITHVRQLVNYEIERFDRIQNGKPVVKFKERMTGDEFNTFEIAHFRLLGDDKYLPYGSSLLNKIRRSFRQLVMAEDAMLTYRIIRAGEKKVFKIDVGNIDEDDIEDYIYKVANKFKKVSQVSQNDGQIDYRFNILGNDEDYFIPVRNANTQTGIDTLPGACLALNTKIELLDGRSLELNDIISEFNSGKKLWSYSINPDTGNIVPGEITWAGITRKNTQVIKITLDNNESIICTPDHKFPTKFNGEKEAKDLTIGESMWAFNKKFEKIKNNTSKKKYDKDYEMIYDHSINDWIYTHRMVISFMNKLGFNHDFIFNKKHLNDIKSVIHHKSLNRYDNSPNNLVTMSYIDHFKYHSHIGIENMSNVEMDDRVKKLNIGFFNYYNNLTDEQKKIRNKNISNKRKEKLNNLNEIEYDNYITRITNNILSESSRNKLKIAMKSPEYREKMRKNGKQIRSNKEINAKIKIAQSFTYNECLINYIINYAKNNSKSLESFVNHLNSTENEFKETFIELNKNKPFYKSFNGFTRHGILKVIRYFNYTNWNDFITKINYFNHKIIAIEYLTDKQDTGTITIDGNEKYHNYHNFALTCGIFTKNSNLDAINDIEYLRDNLITGLGIPKPFLSFQDAAGAGKNMAQYDIRFAKKIARIQQSMIQELNKMAIIHLYLLGYTNEDLTDFTLSLTNPSIQLDLLKSELYREKAQTYAELTRADNGIAAMSHTTAKRVIFNMSDKAIVDDLKQQKMEKVVMQELQDSPVVIKKSGLFADIDKRFGEPIEGMPIEAGSGSTGENISGSTGENISGSTGENISGSTPTIQAGEVGAPVGGELPPAGGELPALKEDSERYYETIVDKLVYGDVKNITNAKHFNKKIIIENTEMNDKLNSNASIMINEIDNLLKTTESFNKNSSTVDVDDINIENIDEIEVN